MSLTLDPLDLAALLCSRVCHDLISPVGAIVNGLEVMEEDGDAETKAFALDLIKKSAEQASAKLQFCRLAFGSAGSAGAQIDTGDAEKVARGFIEDGKVKLDWTLPRALLPKNKVKLLLNMLLIAGNAIPRGGTLQVDPLGEGGFQIKAAGAIARVPPAVPGLLAGTPEGGRDRRPRHPTLLYRPAGEEQRPGACARDRRRDDRADRALSAMPANPRERVLTIRARYNRRPLRHFDLRGRPAKLTIQTKLNAFATCCSRSRKVPAARACRRRRFHGRSVA